MSLKLLIEALKKNPGVAEQKMKVKLVKAGKFKTNVKVGKHKFIFDEEKIIGGTDEGPAPAQMLLASIGGCMLSIMHVWSQLLDIKVNAAEISVKGTLNAQGMLGIDESIPSGFQKIQVDFKIDSDESDAKIKELVDAVEKHCPVHNTVVSSTKVNVKIKAKT